MRDWATRKAVWEYKLRVLFGRPYKDAITYEEFLRRYGNQFGRPKSYSCDCGASHATAPIGRQGCCVLEEAKRAAQRDGAVDGD